MAVRKSPAHAKAKPAKRAAPAKKAAPRKKTAPRRKAVKHPSTLSRVENAILATVAEVDELALDLGLLGAAPPKKKRKR